MTSERLEQAVIALYDHLTREGATAAGAKAALKQQGFTAAEIAHAASMMLQGADKEKK